MKSNLNFSIKLVASAFLLCAIATASMAQDNGSKPKKLTKEEKREIKKAQKKAAIKNTIRAEKAKTHK